MGGFGCALASPRLERRFLSLIAGLDQNPVQKGQKTGRCVSGGAVQQRAEAMANGLGWSIELTLGVRDRGGAPVRALVLTLLACSV